MAYKYLNDDGLKAYTKKVKGALKDLHTPIAISTENTTESMAQNARNIVDFVAKAKAAGIADVNGMVVTCIINDEYSAVLAFYNVANIKAIFGVSVHDDPSEQYVIRISDDGYYTETPIVTSHDTNIVTSDMLVEGARKPIILTSETTEVDEETYQKLLSDDVDVVFKDSYDMLYYVYDVDKNHSVNDIEIRFVNTLGSIDTADPSDYYFSIVSVDISKNAPHTVTTESGDHSLLDILDYSGYLNKSILSPVLQEIDLRGTDAKRKARLDKFEADWKALTGADDLNGARFVGVTDDENTPPTKCVFTFDPNNNAYWGLSAGSEDDEVVRKIYVDCIDGTIYITPLFSHLSPVEIFTDNTAKSKKKNIDNLNAYKANLEQLGVDTTNGYQVPIETIDADIKTGGVLFYSPTAGLYTSYRGLLFIADDKVVRYFAITPLGEVIEEDGLAFSSTLENVTILAQALKDLHTPVPLTATTSTNKTQLNLFLSKVPNAQVMNCTYKNVYAGTLHKINGSWYGVLVGESNTLAGQLSIKLQADGTIVEGTA